MVGVHRTGELFEPLGDPDLSALATVKEHAVLTQEAVAVRLEIPQTHVSDFDLGSKLPNLVTVIRVAVVPDCEVANVASARDRADLQSL